MPEVKTYIPDRKGSQSMSSRSVIAVDCRICWNGAPESRLLVVGFLSVVYRIDGMSGHDVHLVAAGCSHHLSDSEFRVPDSLHKCEVLSCDLSVAK